MKKQKTDWQRYFHSEEEWNKLGTANQLLRVISTGEVQRDEGMRRVETGAGDVWNDKADTAVEMWCRVRHGYEFLVEQLRADLEPWLPKTSDGRAWGPVIARAQKNGLVEKVGYALADSSNQSPKVKWRVK